MSQVHLGFSDVESAQVGPPARQVDTPRKGARLAPVAPLRETRSAPPRERPDRGSTRTGLRLASNELLRAVAELIRERDRLARRAEILDAKLIEVTDLLENGDAARAAYRRGYYAGHKAKSRGRPARVPHQQHATDLPGATEVA
jgi:hypothetical protein